MRILLTCEAADASTHNWRSLLGQQRQSIRLHGHALLTFASAGELDGSGGTSRHWWRTGALRPLGEGAAQTGSATLGRCSMLTPVQPRRRARRSRRAGAQWAGRLCCRCDWRADAVRRRGAGHGRWHAHGGDAAGQMDAPLLWLHPLPRHLPHRAAEDCRRPRHPWCAPAACAGTSRGADKQVGPVVQPVFITVDPKRDTAPRVAEYLKGRRSARGVRLMMRRRVPSPVHRAGRQRGAGGGGVQGVPRVLQCTERRGRGLPCRSHHHHLPHGAGRRPSRVLWPGCTAARAHAPTPWQLSTAQDMADKVQALMQLHKDNKKAAAV